MGPGWRLAFWLLITLRISLELVALVSAQYQTPIVWGDRQYLLMQGGQPWINLISLWQRWDSRWYQEIAEYGYHANDGTAHFFPFYPLVTRVVSLLSFGINPGGHIVWAQLVVSSTAFLVAMRLLYELARLDAGPGAARLAVLLMAFFPTGFFLLAPYTESLYLVLTLSAFWFARRGHHWAAGVAGLCATLTRIQGIFLVLPLVFEYLRQRRAQGKRLGIELAAAGLPFLGILGFSLYLKYIVREPLSAMDLSARWGYVIVPPWKVMTQSWDLIVRTGDPIEILNLTTLLVFTALALYVADGFPFSYALYVWPYMALLLCSQLFMSPYASAARYSLGAFPCFIILARFLTRRPRMAEGCVVVGFAMQALLLERYVHWGFVA